MLERMRQLVEDLNKACDSYYNSDVELMDNYTYDKLYDELLALESKMGITLSNSPTQKVGYEVVSKLEKKKHKHPAKSLDKTKSVDELGNFLSDKNGALSWKLDGLTVILTYKNGELVDAVTRGNGETGECILNNARTFKNIPLTIPYSGEVIVRGEAVIPYYEFDCINEKLSTEEKYKNPRNLVSGSVRQLDSSVCASRNVDFIAFELVTGAEDITSKVQEYSFMEELGFKVVEHVLANKQSIQMAVEYFNSMLPVYKYAVDGLVLTYNDTEYGKSLGETSKFPLHSIAYKWADDLVETKLIDVEWLASRTGLINPVVIFEPVEIEGTTVERASIHNVDIFEQLELGVGDTLTAYKANKIIPQVEDNLTRTNTLKVPKTCPVCGEKAEVLMGKSARFLYCTNDLCSAKTIKKIAHFCSRDAMNIDGISEATLEKLADNGIINSVVDLYQLHKHYDVICKLEGFGDKSFTNMINSINNSKEIVFANFVYALGIPNVGLSTAKLLSKWSKGDIHKLMKTRVMHLKSINGIGEVMAQTIYKFFRNEENRCMIEALLEFITFTAEDTEGSQNVNAAIVDKTFVITGDVHHFKNRKELQAKIESLGGKVSGSVSKKTDYLINNDSESSSSKNKKAIECGVKIITEEEFLEIINK